MQDDAAITRLVLIALVAAYGESPGLEELACGIVARWERKNIRKLRLQLKCLSTSENKLKKFAQVVSLSRQIQCTKKAADRKMMHCKMTKMINHLAANADEAISTPRIKMKRQEHNIKDHRSVVRKTSDTVPIYCDRCEQNTDSFVSGEIDFRIATCNICGTTTCKV